MLDHRMGHHRRRETRRVFERARKPAAKRLTSQKVHRALQYRRDIMRGGSPSDILQLVEQEAAAVDAPEDMLALNLDTADIAANDSEILLEDEDDFEGLNTDSPVDTSAAKQDSSADWRVDFRDRIAIVVTDGQAIFRIPDWASAISDGDLDLRWGTYNHIADWLNRERRSFLAQPSFLGLAQGIIDLSGPIPVLQEGLYNLLNLSCNVTCFSKHCQHGILVWSSRTMPMEACWSQEAKWAWCACAALQRQQDCGYATRTSPLGDPSIQPPRASSERDLLRRKVIAGFSLGPIDFVQLLCVLVNCKWRDVLVRYGDMIFPRG